MISSKISVNNIDDRFIWIKGLLKEYQTIYNVVNIYGPHDPVQKRINLWHVLLDIKRSNPGFWILFGDFNTDRYPHERMNLAFCTSSTTDFNRFIDDGHLTEYNMGGGRKFTYNQSAGAKLSKFDRILVSQEKSYHCTSDLKIF